MRTGLVTVILPTYNNAQYLPDAIESVLRQTYCSLELIVVDDGSSDNTVSVVQPFLVDKRLSYYCLAHNSGVVNARNFALNHAHGEYIAFIDSDDIWYSQKLKKQLLQLKMLNIDLVYSYYDVIDSSKKIVRSITTLPKSGSYQKLLKTNFIPMLTVLIKRNKMFGYQFESVKHEDYALWLTMLRETGLKVGLCPEKLAQYRIHEKSLSSNKFKSLVWVWNLFRKHEKLSVIRAVYYILFYIVYGLVKHF